ADPWRRLYWFSRARWVALFLLAIASLLAGAKLALGAAILAALLHLSLLRILLKPERQDLRESIPARLSVLALLYGASDLVLLWLAHRGGVSSLLLSELLLCFVFLFAVIVRPRLAILAPVFGIVAASLAFFFTASGGVESERVAGSILNPFAVASVLAVLSVILGVAVFFWMTGTIWLTTTTFWITCSNFWDKAAKASWIFCSCPFPPLRRTGAAHSRKVKKPSRLGIALTRTSTSWPTVSTTCSIAT